MTDISYRPGAWLAVVRNRTVVMLPQDSDAALVSDVWDALGEGVGMDVLLERVSGGFVHGWTGMRPFAVVSYRTSLHAVLRGRLRLESTGDGGRIDEVSGEQVATWSERILPGGNPFSITSVDADSNVPLGGPWLPLVEGVVGCAALRAIPVGSPVVGAADSGAVPDLNATISPEIFTTSAASAATEVPVAEVPAAEVSTTEVSTTEVSAAEVPAAEDDATTGYDHLWDRTVVRRVEDAAVRQDEATEVPAVHEASSGAAGGDAAAPASAAPVLVPQSAEPTGAVELIDSVPWLRPSERAREETDPSVSVTPTTVPDDGHLRPTLPDLSHGPLDGDDGDRDGHGHNGGHGDNGDNGDNSDGDHDGQTIMRSSLPGNAPGNQPGAAFAEARAATPQDEGTGPLVLARLCPDGHANPPTQPGCSLCAKPLAAEPRQVRRPSLGRIRISTGEVVELDRPAVIGRQPSASRLQGDDMPRMVQVRSEAQDISRSHVEIRLDGWHVMLCDLKATNGTVLIRGDRPPHRLDQGEITIVLDGDIAELGEDVTLTFEGIR